jgi:hypothetical protein
LWQCFVDLFIVYTKIGKERGNPYQKRMTRSPNERHTQTYRSLTDVFLDQKRVNVCEPYITVF